jgi:hypothetical protein
VSAKPRKCVTPPSLSALQAWQPCFRQNTYREETSLKQSQDNTTSSKCVPIIRETHANHNSTPSHTQASEEVARTDLACKNSRRRLKDNISSEEDESDGRLSEITSQHQLMYNSIGVINNSDR